MNCILILLLLCCSGKGNCSSHNRCPERENSRDRCERKCERILENVCEDICEDVCDRIPPGWERAERLRPEFSPYESQYDCGANFDKRCVRREERRDNRGTCGCEG